MESNKITVGIADMKMAKDSGMLITYALGSCIGICLYDQKIKLAAMVHIMLPLNMEPGRANTMKYADTGIRETLKKMEAKGASRSRITAKIAGGAKMFEVSGASAIGNVGLRNAQASKAKLKQLGIPLLAEDTGLNYGRTVELYPATGEFYIKAVGKKLKII